MAAAALAARSSLPTRTRQRRAARLAFDELGGPLVAVCGLAGGAGTTTLALLLAHHAAMASAAPILLTEADPVRAGLATLTGAATPHPLIDLAQQTANGTPPTETFLELEPGLRLIAATPRRSTPTTPAAVQALLGEARAAHGLVIVDCATTWTPDSPTLASVTHILWTTPAHPIGFARARALLDSDLMPSPGRAVEVLVATAQHPRAGVSVRALRRLAAQRCEHLVLIPHNAAAARGDLACNDATAHALNRLAPTLRRHP